MPDELVYLNGDYVPHSEAKIHITDCGFTMGFIITESTRTFGHKPFKLREHIDRLYKSVKATRFDCGVAKEQMERLTLEIWAKNEPLYAPGDDAWIIHHVTPGKFAPNKGQMDAAARPTIIIATMFLDLTYWADFYIHGAHAVTPVTRIQPSQCKDVRIKNRNRMTYFLGEQEVKLVDPKGQSLFMDIEGRVTENKGGNFFVVDNGVIKTAKHNVLEGVSRATVFELAEKVGLPVVECDLLPYDVINAQEAFFTSTPYCLFPATRFNGWPIGDGKVGPVVKRLLRAWSDMVGLDIVQQARDQAALSN